MKFDVVALGELLIDFTDNGISSQGNPIFEANPGGAPGNVLSMLSKLGHKTAFIGKVGADMFGNRLIDALTQSGIDTKGVIVEEKANTTLAFVQNSSDGEREFSFFRNPGADTLLHSDELDADMIENCKIFHFGSLSLTHQPARDATMIAVKKAAKAGAIISFDPNLRPLLWDTNEAAKKQIVEGCSVCNILKVSDEELYFITEADNIADGIHCLQKLYPGIKLILITRGSKGAVGYWGDYQFSYSAFLNANTIDTTGAGDTFLGSCLSFIIRFDINNPDENVLKEMIIFANAAASLVTVKKGALLAMPEKYEVEKLIEQRVQ